ncbi:hypothetical protein VB776_03330 [Arcicella sp. DC2W]|uniref:Uncharacterized protein n=1 Tax=Arcicella gelida TaxID=2984195 RepID=A0ABU5S0J2_9BACT|nr:hypothetical protein [Arcicella sp. DC2W]MEA5401934.1 hypothetical protein [Arcicella sp. DC2W]
MSKEFTKKELIDSLQTQEIDGKNSLEIIAELVFDEKFPKELFENAKNELVKVRDDRQLFSELCIILIPKWKEIKRLREQNIILKDNSELNFEKLQINNASILEIENSIKPLEIKFDILQKRIETRNRKID